MSEFIGISLLISQREGRRTEDGGRKLEVGGWRLEVGDWIYWNQKWKLL